MPKARTEVAQLENMIKTGKKKFVRYAEGAALYSLGLHTFQEVAKEANAVYRVKRCVLVNTENIPFPIQIGMGRVTQCIPKIW